MIKWFQAVWALMEEGTTIGDAIRYASVIVRVADQEFEEAKRHDEMMGFSFKSGWRHAVAFAAWEWAKDKNEEKSRGS